MYLSYSVDMVRLQTIMHIDRMREFETIGMFNDTNVEYWKSSRASEYNHNWLIKEQFGREVVSFWVGYKHNMEKPKSKYTLVVEYNPNKLTPGGFHLENGKLTKLLNGWFNDIGIVEVKSVDVAIDIPYNINDIQIDKMSKKVYKLHKEVGDDNYTHYIGKGYGRVKVYNKARQLGLEGVNLTRYEITLDIKKGMNEIDKYEVTNELPMIYLSATEGLEGTLRALMYAVEHGFPVEQLSRKYREKLRDVIRDKTEIQICKKNIATVVSDYIKGLTKTICLSQ